MDGYREAWFDDAAGPLVRPYAITSGRTAVNRYNLELITLVVALQPEVHGAVVDAEYARILRVCASPQSVAEIAALVDLPVCVVKVLISDLIDRRYVIFQASPPPTTATVDLDLMQKVLDGIRKL